MQNAICATVTKLLNSLWVGQTKQPPNTQGMNKERGISKRNILMPKKNTTKKPQIAMVVFSYYPSDPRVRREAETLLQAGMSVDVICLGENLEPKRETVNGMNVYRLPCQRKRGGKLRYFWEYTYFIFLAFFTLSTLYIRKRYNLVHVHNMPDILVFSSLLPRMCGSKVILDLHDPTPEVYMAKYKMKYSDPFIRILCFLERYSIRFSNLVLTPNIAFRKLFISRGCPKEKIHIIMNAPDERIFCPTNAQKNDNKASDKNKFVLMYHGTIVERYGLDTALYAISQLNGKVSKLEFNVYGIGDYVERFLELVDELNLKDIVQYHGSVSLEEISKVIEGIDLGLIPNKKNVFTEINMPTRIFEYLSIGKPVIAPRTKGIMDYFDEKSLNFFEPDKTESLAQVILEVYSNPMRRRAVLNRGIAIYKKYRWELQRQNLLDLVTTLLDIDTCDQNLKRGRNRRRLPRKKGVVSER